MVKNYHEIRDAIHIFIKLDNNERKVLASLPFQRLRYIHQLATTYLVYPGATHKRFEHSLGVMELAGRVFDVVTNQNNIHSVIREIVPEITQEQTISYWRRVLRVAALFHDVGHLPFSHAAEKELLPEGWDHEKITIGIINSPEMKEIWSNLTPPLRPEDITKLAVGPQKFKDTPFSNWEAILSEIIVGDAFGVDRIDYLLRDSYCAGVSYGRFDHYRLIDTLRILPRTDGEEEGSQEPLLGVEEGGFHSSEALLLARYFMYSQVYFHPVRRIYDIHLKDFLSKWLQNGKFSTNINNILDMTDNEVLVAIKEAAKDNTSPGHDPARRILKREHFKLFYQRDPSDLKKNANANEVIFNAIKEQYGEENVRRDSNAKNSTAYDFPVLCYDNRICSSYEKSQDLQTIPFPSFDYIFIKPELRQEADNWLKKHRVELLKIKPEEE